MRSLLVLFVLHAVLRFPGDNPVAAAVMSAVLLCCMLLAMRFAGWHSLSGGVSWLKSNPGLAFLVLGGTCIVVTLGITYGGAMRTNHVLAFGIEAFFLGLAFLAMLRAFYTVGIVSIQSWFRR